MIGKITVGEDLHEARIDEHDGLFNVLSNAMYFLDHSLENKSFELYQQLFLFLTKLTVQLGITPDIDHCLYCQKELLNKDMCLFLSHEGGFSCHECQTQKDEFLSDNRLLLEEFQMSGIYRSMLKLGFNLAFKDYSELGKIDQNLASMSFNYINYQFEFKADQFKTWKLL